ncbi:MAG: prepilin peptidase [Desulfuromonas sp.]|nr:MAG: prepilin peptidase [Desulfuromonas sp.]
MSVQVVIWVVLACVFVFGTVIGSFLNVCIARVPAGESVVSPRSKCPECGTFISWYQNIPLLSYMFLRGRCAGCGVKISLRYPLVELLTGILFVAVLWYFGLGFASPVFWVFVSLLICISFIDYDHQIIPNVISLPGIVLGFVFSFLLPGMPWLDSLLGIVAGGGSLWLVAFIYYLLTRAEGMGMGDVKLLAMIGAFLGYQAVLPVIFIASLLGSVVGILLMVITRSGRKLAIPFGPYLSMAALITLLWGDALLKWYLSFL